MGGYALLEATRQSAVRGFAPPREQLTMAPPQGGDAPVRVERCAVRRIVETSAVLPEAWLMGRFALLEATRQSAVRWVCATSRLCA